MDWPGASKLTPVPPLRTPILTLHPQGTESEFQLYTEEGPDRVRCRGKAIHVHLDMPRLAGSKLRGWKPLAGDSYDYDFYLGLGQQSTHVECGCKQGILQRAQWAVMEEAWQGKFTRGVSFLFPIPGVLDRFTDSEQYPRQPQLLFDNEGRGWKIPLIRPARGEPWPRDALVE